MLCEIFMQVNCILTTLCQLTLGGPVIVPHCVHVAEICTFCFFFCTAIKFVPLIFVLLMVWSVLLTLFLHVVFKFGHFQVKEELLKQHYAELKDRPFFPKLVKYMSSGPVVPMVC